jgi:arsenite methyltransferase
VTVNSTQTQTHLDVQRYYGEILKTKADLQTSACCPTAAPPRYVQRALERVPAEIQARSYGCGSPVPLALEGCTVLDLGCGTGQDAYVCAERVGPSGRVIGVDMTPAQLVVGREHQEAHRQALGYAVSNVDFRHGFLEELGEAGIADASVDVVISNCVLNLAPDKSRVFSEIMRVLKPGGELYFSDVFASRRLPAWMRQDTQLVGECLGGAMYTEDFRRLMQQLGIADYRIVSSGPLEATSPEVADKIGLIAFSSLTVRAFKLPALEDRCEDYGQVAYYEGSIPDAPNAFVLDDHHVFERGRPVSVCSNTAMMLTDTRLAPHFRVAGDTSTHFGLFDCGPQPADDSSAGACC